MDSLNPNFDRALGASGSGFDGRRADWTFLTNHGHVLICLWREPQARLRDIATAVGITERAVQGILADLTAAGIVQVHKDGRRNTYTVDGSHPLRHPLERATRVEDLLNMAGRNQSAGRT